MMHHDSVITGRLGVLRQLDCRVCGIANASDEGCLAFHPFSSEGKDFKTLLHCQRAEFSGVPAGGNNLNPASQEKVEIPSQSIEVNGQIGMKRRDIDADDGL